MTHEVSVLADWYEPNQKIHTPPAIPTSYRLFDAKINLVANANGHFIGDPFGEREFISFLGYVLNRYSQVGKVLVVSPAEGIAPTRKLERSSLVFSLISGENSV